ncbi:MAG TPA: hypothetical protein VGM07_04075 [Stellaceae bacterium]|jgi:hypothetical protein
MRLVQPSPRQAVAIVQAMYAVVSAAGNIAPVPLEEECIAAAQRHLLGLDAPLAGSPGPLPDDLAAVIDTPELRLLTVRILVLLPIMDRRVLPEKVAVVERAAALLDVAEVGLRILRCAARGQYRRVTLISAKRFIAWWSPVGKARLRDWVRFMWWMLPKLHTPGMVRRNQQLRAKFQGLASFPEGTFGRTLYNFYAEHEIPLPGEPKSVPWAMHEVYHVLCEYGVSLEGELLLTAFSGGTLNDTCLDQLLFGLLSYHAGKQIVGGVVSEGILQPDDYFRAIARGAAINVDLASGWDLWKVVDTPACELRSSYNIPAILPRERDSIMPVNGLLTGSGYSTPALA